MNMQRFVMNFPVKILQELRKVAQEEGVGIGELVRRILSEWFNKRKQ